MDGNIAAHLNAGLHRQSAHQNDQAQDDYDIHDEGLERISFAVPASDNLVYLANTSVDYVFLGWREEFDRVRILHGELCRARICPHRFLELLQPCDVEGEEDEEGEAGHNPKGDNYKCLEDDLTILGQGNVEDWVIQYLQGNSLYYLTR